MLRKWTSVCVLISFFIMHSFGIADSPLQNLPVFQPQPFSARSLNRVKIPPLLGILTERYTGTGEKMVIHIQDSHAHFEAQQNISKLIHFFIQNFPTETPRLVLLEGADGLIDPSALASIENDYIRDRIGTYFLKEALITGAEYYSIMTPGDTLLMGIDDQKLYLKNLKFFQKSQEKESQLQAEIKGLIGRIESIEEKIFSKELLELNQIRKLHEKGEAVLGQYCLLLKHDWKETGDLVVLYPNFSRIVQVTELESRMKYQHLQEELFALTLNIQARLDRKELENLIQKSLLHRLGKIDPGEYFKFLYSQASRLKVDFRPFPNLSLFFESILIRHELDLGQVYKELDEVDHRIRASLYRSEREEKLDKLDRYLASLERLSRLSLSREEFEFYLKQKKSYSIEQIPALLRSFEHEVESPIIAPVSVLRFQNALSDLEGFYQVALQRDETILENVLRRMDEEKSSVSILITGGFHTSGMTEGFRKKNVSYLVVAPHVSSFSDPSIYHSTMMDLMSPMDREFKALTRLVAPIRFATNPFGDRTDWERIMGKAILFKDFFEKVRGTRGKNVLEAYILFVNERLVHLKKPDGTLRFTRAELKARIARLRYVARHLKVDWDKSHTFKDSFFVAVHIKDKIRILRLSQGKIVLPHHLEYEEFGQLDENITFYVLPNKYTVAFQSLLGVNAISAAVLESALRHLHPRDIAILAQVFRNVKISSLKRHHQLAWQFALYRRMSSNQVRWEDGVLQSYDFVEDLLTSVTKVEVVENLRTSKKAASPLEHHYDLIHATALAARRVIRWLSDTGSKFISNRADKEAAQWLRAYFNSLDWLRGRVAIGEGERDRAPMLYIGERLGRGDERVDMAMDVVELTKGVIRKEIQGTVSIVAYAERGGLLNAPDVYMRKIVVGPRAKKAGVDVMKSISWNLERISQALGQPISSLRGAILLRPRHKKLIRELLVAGIVVDQSLDPTNDDEFDAFWKRVEQEIKRTGFLELGNLTLMGDGDLMPVFGLVSGKIDFVLGAGGAPEGVISAAIVESIGGQMSAQLCAYETLQESAQDSDLERDFEKYTPEEMTKLAKFGFVRPGTEKKGEIPWNKVWSSHDLAIGKDVVVIASAVKDSPWIESLKAPKIDPESGEVQIYSVVASKTGRVRVAKVTYDLGIQRLRKELEKATTEEAKITLSLEWVEILEGHGFYSEAIAILKDLEGGVKEARLKLKIESTLSFLEGRVRLIEGTQLEEAIDFFEKAIVLSPMGSSEARSILIRLYRYLGEEAEKRESQDQAIVYYEKALEKARFSGFKRDLAEVEEKLMTLGVSVRKLRIPEQEAKKLLLLQTQWNEENRPPVALVYAGQAHPEKLKQLQEIIQRGLKTGDAIFLGGELAYAFLRYKHQLKEISQEGDVTSDLTVDLTLQGVREIMQGAVERPREHGFMLHQGIMIYLPLDHVHSHNGDGLNVLAELPESWIPKEGERVDIGEKTAFHYQKKLIKFRLYVAVGLLGRPGVYIYGTNNVLMSLVDKVEGGQLVFLAGEELVEEAQALGISDAVRGENRVTGLFHDDSNVLRILTREGLERDVFVGGVDSLLRDEKTDPEILPKLLSWIEGSQKMAVLRVMARHILEQFLGELVRSVQETVFASDVRVRNVFTSAVLKRFPLEAKLKKDVTSNDILKMISEDALGLFDALVFESGIDEKSHWPYFYLFLNVRETGLANLLALHLFVAHDGVEGHAGENFRGELHTERVLRQNLLEIAA